MLSPSTTFARLQPDSEPDDPLNAGAGTDGGRSIAATAAASVGPTFRERPLNDSGDGPRETAGFAAARLAGELGEEEDEGDMAWAELPAATLRQDAVPPAYAHQHHHSAHVDHVPTTTQPETKGWLHNRAAHEGQRNTAVDTGAASHTSDGHDIDGGRLESLDSAWQGRDRASHTLPAAAAAGLEEEGDSSDSAVDFDSSEAGSGRSSPLRSPSPLPLDEPGLPLAEGRLLMHLPRLRLHSVPLGGAKKSAETEATGGDDNAIGTQTAPASFSSSSLAAPTISEQADTQLQPDADQAVVAPLTEQPQRTSSSSEPASSSSAPTMRQQADTVLHSEADQALVALLAEEPQPLEAAQEVLSKIVANANAQARAEEGTTAIETDVDVDTRPAVATRQAEDLRVVHDDAVPDAKTAETGVRVLPAPEPAVQSNVDAVSLQTELAAQLSAANTAFPPAASSEATAAVRAADPVHQTETEPRSAITRPPGLPLQRSSTPPATAHGAAADTLPATAETESVASPLAPPVAVTDAAAAAAAVFAESASPLTPRFAVTDAGAGAAVSRESPGPLTPSMAVLDANDASAADSVTSPLTPVAVPGPGAACAADSAASPSPSPSPSRSLLPRPSPKRQPAAAAPKRTGGFVRHTTSLRTRDESAVHSRLPRPRSMRNTPTRDATVSAVSVTRTRQAARAVSAAAGRELPAAAQGAVKAGVDLNSIATDRQDRTRTSLVAAAPASVSAKEQKTTPASSLTAHVDADRVPQRVERSLSSAPRTTNTTSTPTTAGRSASRSGAPAVAAAAATLPPQPKRMRGAVAPSSPRSGAAAVESVPAVPGAGSVRRRRSSSLSTPTVTPTRPPTAAVRSAKTTAARTDTPSPAQAAAPKMSAAASSRTAYAVGGRTKAPASAKSGPAPPTAPSTASGTTAGSRTKTSASASSASARQSRPAPVSPRSPVSAAAGTTSTTPQHIPPRTRTRTRTRPGSLKTKSAAAAQATPAAILTVTRSPASTPAAEAHTPALPSAVASPAPFSAQPSSASPLPAQPLPPTGLGDAAQVEWSRVRRAHWGSHPCTPAALDRLVGRSTRTAFAINTAGAKSSARALRMAAAVLACREYAFRAPQHSDMVWCCGSWYSVLQAEPAPGTFVSRVPGLLGSARKVSATTPMPANC